MSSNRRDRSRSPNRLGNVGRRRDNKNGKGLLNPPLPGKKALLNPPLPNEMTGTNNMMNSQQMMLSNMMMPQGNMMMASGMYPNMMMPNTMMTGAMMPSTGMELMPASNMDVMSQSSMDMTAIGGQAMTQSSVTPSMDMNMMGGMMMDPSMMGNMAMYSNMGSSDMQVMDKQEIVLKHCKLIPPEEGSNDPPRRPKPPGCRTIFVGGLPENIRESIVREVFENYGRIHILRLSNKNFCHIRFDRESSVDAAMGISGWCLKLINKDDDKDEDTKANNGWIHVDYALSRDDQNEYERRQRQMQRAQEQQMQQLTAQQQALTRTMYRRSPSPVRVQPFSNASLVQLIEKLKSEEHFANTLPTLISWLERGECSKKNSTQFYSMIQATNSHIRRLFNEKVQAEEELQETRERIKNHIQSLIEQLEQVAKVFTAATHQRVWDHFTKPQRKNIETWQKMSQEFSTLKDEFNEKFYSSEENDYNNGYNSRPLEMGTNDEFQKIKLENDSLRFQLEAYKNEVDVVKADASKELEKFKAQFIARQALQGAGFESKPPLPSPVSKPPPPPPTPDDINKKVVINETVEVGCGEARLIGVMSAFLQVHPQGASLDYVVSYVRALLGGAAVGDVSRVLQKHPDAFRRTTTGVGADIEHKWTFAGFQLDQ